MGLFNVCQACPLREPASRIVATSTARIHLPATTAQWRLLYPFKEQKAIVLIEDLKVAQPGQTPHPPLFSPIPLIRLFYLYEYSYHQKKICKVETRDVMVPSCGPRSHACHQLLVQRYSVPVVILAGGRRIFFGGSSKPRVE
jgi:hypothetical protein